MMFELQKLLPPTEINIKLQTRDCIDIKNTVEPDPSTYHVGLIRNLVQHHGNLGKWRLRRDCYGFCNCAGHVWASRRTAIHEPEEWIKILDHDGYRYFNPDTEEPHIGDVIIYSNKQGPRDITGFSHIGIIFKVCRINETGSACDFIVLSKWDAHSGEYLHRYRDVGHLNDTETLCYHFYTERPLEVS